MRAQCHCPEIPRRDSKDTKDGTRMGQQGQGSKDGTARTWQYGRDSKDGTARTGHQGHRTGQWSKDGVVRIGE